MSHLLVLGHGYSSAATLEGLDPAFRVTVTARSPAKIAALAAGGLEVIGYDGLAPAPALAEALRRATHLLITLVRRIDIPKHRIIIAVNVNCACSASESPMYELRE